MEQRTAAQEEISLNRHAAESGAVRMPESYYNPFIDEMNRELAEAESKRFSDGAEIALKLLQFASDGIKLPDKKAVYHRVQINIPPGWEIQYHKEDRETGINVPFVVLLRPDKTEFKRWEYARLKSIYKPRSKKGDRNPKAEIRITKHVDVSTAARIGTRLVACAVHGGVDSIRDMTGAGTGEALGVTRQARSLTNKAMEAKIKEATGAKAGIPNLRQKPDPRKGKTLEEIKSRKQSASTHHAV